MKPHYSDDLVTLYHGDCLDVLRELPDNSVDAVVTDPPYGLSNTDTGHVIDTFTRWINGERDYIPSGAGFMGKAWDAFVPPVAVWDECLRVLKPGGHMLVFAGSRTVDLMGLAIRLAGFEIRDQCQYLYGSGFPKSLDVSKAIDKAAGAEREVVATIPDRWAGKGDVLQRATQAEAESVNITAPATPDAERWQGWGTALKPAHEPIVLARKPLIGTVAANVLAHGTGALNVDGCRINIDGPDDRSAGRRTATFGTEETVSGGDGSGGWSAPEGKGRWPANVILDDTAAALLDEQSGVSVSRAASMPLPKGHSFAGADYGGDGSTNGATERGHNESGGASRFFYTAKAGSDERPRVKREGAGEGRVIAGTVKRCPECGCKTIRSGAGGLPSCGHGKWEHVPAETREDHIAHPTVKPLSLMRWLVRLVTPPGGTALEPFAGSGTTLEACVIEGFHAIGIEREDDYLKLIEQRLTKPIQPDIFGGVA